MMTTFLCSIIVQLEIFCFFIVPYKYTHSCLVVKLLPLLIWNMRISNTTKNFQVTKILIFTTPIFLWNFIARTLLTRHLFIKYTAQATTSTQKILGQVLKCNMLLTISMLVLSQKIYFIPLSVF